MKIDKLNTKEELLKAVKELDRLLDEGRDTLKEYRGKTDTEIGFVKFILLMELSKNLAIADAARTELLLKLNKDFNIRII